MTSIKDLETQIEGAEDALAFAKGELADLKTRLRELKEQQEKDKQPEPGPEQESLFGRWATHPTYGRGIIVSSEPNDDGYVRIACRNDNLRDGAEIHYEHPEHLTFDPATLNTVKDFNDAPEGTIAEIMVEPKGVYVKKDSVWRGAGEEYPTPVQSLAKARVIRWGNGQ
ncbi:hypothetical protein [Corynebacterium sp. 239_CJEI]|uniref:hypothetical protein n=1 Tax=Corynebacterium sp. 239_CJEI TaxID=2715674 RepID=UPI000667E3C2|nr:hypothetical protein [Corynebacterium sp. 239_CJEI]